MSQEVRALIFSSPHHNVFAERARRLMQLSAGHIASAVENLRLIEIQRRHTEPLKSFAQAHHWRYSEQGTPSYILTATISIPTHSQEIKA